MNEGLRKDESRTQDILLSQIIMHNDVSVTIVRILLTLDSIDLVKYS